MRELLDGERVTSPPGGRYEFDDLVLLPRPVQKRLPIMIGGAGEKKTLRTVAKYADMWNAMGIGRDSCATRSRCCSAHCDDVGRDRRDRVTAGCKPIIRDTGPRRGRVWAAQMAANRTPMADVEDDDTFWVGHARAGRRAR